MDTRSQSDPVEKVYDARVRGACFISTVAGDRMHLHGGCWVTACAHEPARLLVAFPKEFEGAQIVRRGGAFAVTLAADTGWDLGKALFAGRHSLEHLGRERFLRAPSGCPVVRGGVAYFDCRLAEAVDFADFLVAVGDVRAAAVLHADLRNVTVNEIQRRPAAGPVHLPFQGFDDEGEGLAPAPDEAADGAVLERVYARRQWGLFLVSARAGEREHLHVGCWAIQCSHTPPRMLVAVDRRLPAADLIRESGTFALSLLAEDQLPLAMAILGGACTPAEAGDEHFLRVGPGLPVLAGGVGHFACRVEGEFNEATDHAGFYGPVTDFAWGRRDAAQLRDDQLAAALTAATRGNR